MTQQERTWEVIVKYSGSLAFLKGLEACRCKRDGAFERIRDSYRYLSPGLDATGPDAGDRIYRKTKEAVFLCKSGKDSLLYYSGAERAVRPVWGRRAGGGAGFRRGLCPSGFSAMRTEAPGFWLCGIRPYPGRPPEGYRIGTEYTAAGNQRGAGGRHGGGALSSWCPAGT